MKSYEIFAIYKLKMWIAVEVFLIVSTLSLIGLDIAIVGISQEYRNLYPKLPLKLYAFDFRP